MKKVSILIVMVCALIWNVQAQKMKGDLKMLKEVNKVNLIFDYEGMMIDGDDEKEYVQENAKERGEGDEEGWKNKWYNDFRTTIYQPKFIHFFNKEAGNLTCGEFADAAYTMIVKINDLDPGNFAGPFSNPCKLTGEIRVVKTGTTEILTTISFKKTIGNALLPQLEDRIGSSFSYLGQNIGKVFKKNIK